MFQHAESGTGPKAVKPHCTGPESGMDFNTLATTKANASQNASAPNIITVAAKTVTIVRCGATKYRSNRCAWWARNASRPRCPHFTESKSHVTAQPGTPKARAAKNLPHTLLFKAKPLRPVSCRFPRFGGISANRFLSRLPSTFPERTAAARLTAPPRPRLPQ